MNEIDKKDKKDEDIWYASLTNEERASLMVKLCLECCHVFDDNPTKLVCKTCEERVVDGGGSLYV